MTREPRSIRTVTEETITRVADPDGLLLNAHRADLARTA